MSLKKRAEALRGAFSVVRDPCPACGYGIPSPNVIRIEDRIPPERETEMLKEIEDRGEVCALCGRTTIVIRGDYEAKEEETEEEDPQRHFTDYDRPPDQRRETSPG